jgi:membrane protease subunit HflK
MSEDHDHPHHDHEHGPGHDHDHSHPATPAAAADSAPLEDAGSQALAEALRSSFFIVKVVMAAMLVVFLFSGFFKVEQGQRAVILRFGKPVGVGDKALLGPGLHWSWPYPIDDIIHIHYSQLQQVRSTVGWYNTTPEKEALGGDDEDARPSINPAVDGYVITGDGNILHTRATLIYRIDEPINYEFNFSNASNAVENALDNAIIYAAARFKVDDILTRQITLFQETVRNRAVDLIQKENLSVVVEQCQVESKPPSYLKPAFDGVLTALSTRDKNHNEAVSYQNQVLSKAESDAASRTNSAQAERVRLVESVRAEAQRFTDLLPRYQSNSAVFVNILLAEKIGQVLANPSLEKFFVPERADGKTRELRLQLSREPAEPVAPAKP